MATSYSSWKNYASTSCSIRIKYDITETETTYKLTATIQRWDKYALVPSGQCWLWFTDAGYSSAMSFPSASNNDSTRNVGSMTYTWNKGTSAKSITVWFETDQWFDTITDSGWTRIGTSTASWTLTIPAKTSYAVKYAANGGSSTPSTQTKWHGTAITLAAAISRANASATAYVVTLNHNYSGSTDTTKSAARTTSYTFSKWKATNGTLYSAKASYSANAATTMTAQWTSSTSTASVTLTTPTRSGYAFDGWATSSTGSKAYNGGASMTPSGNTTLYARWNRTVTYNANSGSGAPSSQTALATSAITLSSTTPTRTGYAFAGWNTSSDGSGTSYSAGGTYAKQNPSVTLYAKWNRTVTYNANGGSGAPSAQTAASTSVIKISGTVPTRTGYTFAGWNTAANGSGTNYSSGGSYPVNNPSVTLYAKWNRTVTYNANGGSGAPSAQTSLATSAITISSTKPTRTGYKFMGWNTKSDGSGTSYSANETYAANNPSVTLYAQWQILLTVSITSVTRCQQDGTADPLGSYAKVVFDWSSGSGSSVAVSFDVTVGTGSATVTRTAASYTGEQAIVGAISPRTAYTATVTGTVSGSDTSVSATKPAPVEYKAPAIASVATNRVDSAHRLDDEGTVLKLDVKWSVCQSPSQTVTMTAQAVNTSGIPLFPQPVSLPISVGVYGGTDTLYIDDEPFGLDEQYVVTVTLTDGLGVTASKGNALSTAYFPMDVLGDQNYYQPTEDQAIDQSKTYYAIGESGWYEPVEEPDIADIGNYFEKTGPRPGHGISFGAACKEEGFHVSMPMNIHDNDMTVDGNALISGDLTMDGSTIEINDSNIDIGTSPASAVYDRAIEVFDANGNSIGWLQVAQDANGSHSVCLGASNSDDSSQNQLWLGYDANDSPTAWASQPTIIRNALGASSGIWPRTLGGTGIGNIGYSDMLSNGSDKNDLAASTWYQSRDMLIPAGCGFLIARLVLTTGSTAGYSYVYLTKKTLSATQTENPDYQTTDFGLRIIRGTGTSEHKDVVIVMPYNHETDTRYYLHYKSISTTTIYRTGSIRYLKLGSYYSS